MVALDTGTLIHSSLLKHFTHEFNESKKPILKRFQRAENAGSKKSCSGDEIVAKVEDLFLNGLGIKWSETQIRIFNALIDSVLPRIYLDTWEQNAARVMEKRGIKKIYQETLVVMAR